MTQQVPADFAEMLQHLRTLGVMYPECTPRAQRALGKAIYIAEKSGASHFGGVEVFAWYLVSRALRVRPQWLQLVGYVEKVKARGLQGWPIWSPNWRPSMATPRVKVEKVNR